MTTRFNPILWLFCLVANIHLLAQDTEIVATQSAKESLQIAQGLYAQGALVKAEKQLLHTIRLKDNFAIAHRLLGKVYFDQQAYPAAIEAYEKSFELDDKLSRAAFYECAESYFMEGNTELANYYFTRFKQMKDKRYANAEKENALEIEYDNLLPIREQNILFINQLDTAVAGNYTIQNLGKNINSKHDEYLASVTSDGKHLLYTRDIKGADENIFLSTAKNDQWASGKRIDGELNTPNNEGMAKFEAHGNTFYFAGCKREDADSGCDIYQALFEDGSVSEIFPLEGRLNSFYWDSQPSISCDGQQLFFASTRGGFGGSDIWVSHRQANGEWGVPENLGVNINTPGDEEAPFIATDGETLYFTSDRHPGMGNGDIFVSYLENNEWSIPDNLGYPINSPAKELGIYIQGDNQTAYFASNRKGGLGGLDIYQTTMPELFRPQPMVQLEGRVYDADTNEPIQTTIKIGHDHNQWEVTTNPNGRFFHCLSGNKGYSFQIFEDGYIKYIDAVYLVAQDNRTNVQVDIPLQKAYLKETQPEAPYQGKDRLTKTIIQIYFDFDSANINDKGYTKLEKVLELMEKYDDWTIEVVGFADNIGDATYNKQLSQQRADEVVQFLRTKSSMPITSNIKVMGKGIAGNQNSEVARQKSRRVDVVMTR